MSLAAPAVYAAQLTCDSHGRVASVVQGSGAYTFGYDSCAVQVVNA